MLLNEPVIVGVATIVITALAPLAKFPRAQLKFALLLHDPCEGAAEPKLRPAGRLSVTVKPEAAAGPEFVTTIRSARLVLTKPGLGDTVCVIPRSALTEFETLSFT